jgi:Arc/MetJ family transcription regulator
MKTTVEITDGLLEDVRRQAERERTTLRALIEEALRRLLTERRRRERFVLRRAAFGGEGIDPEVGSWEEVRRRAYEGHGT